MQERELYLLWAVEYLNERIFTLLASYAESRILGALNLKQSKQQQQQQQSLNGFESFHLMYLFICVEELTRINLMLG